MTETEKMAGEMNGFFKAIGEKEQLQIPNADQCKSELELLRIIEEQYTTKLLQRMHKYRSLPPHAIPGLFLVTLKKREYELESKKAF